MIKSRLICIVGILFLFGCGSNRIKLEKESLVEIQKAQFSKWASGINGGGSGFNIKVLTKGDELPNKLVGLYFRGKYSDFKFEKPNIYSAFIQTEKPRETNLDLIKKSSAADNKEEESNNFPFELTSNEAVIVSLNSKKKKYFKILLEKVDIGISR